MSLLKDRGHCNPVWLEGGSKNALIYKLYIGMLGNGYTVDFCWLDLKQCKVLSTLWNQALPGPGI